MLQFNKSLYSIFTLQDQVGKKKIADKFKDLKNHWWNILLGFLENKKGQLFSSSLIF